MKNDEWFRHCLEKQSKVNKRIRFLQRVDYTYERQLYDFFKSIENDLLLQAAAMPSNRRVIEFTISKPDAYVWDAIIRYERKERRFVYILYFLPTGEQYIFLKNSPFANT